MKRTVSLFEFMPYGAPELIAVARPHLAGSLAAASLALLIVFGAALQFSPGLRAEVERHPVRVQIDGGIVVPPPQIPSFQLPTAIRTSISHAGSQPALVVPVPGVIADDHAVDSGRDLNFGTGGPVGPQVSPAEPDAVVGRVAEEPMPIRGVYAHVDELPIAITEFKPPYPDLAHDAGIEGLVIVHALVGKDGRVLRVELDEKFSSPLLNDTALEAARRWVFKPAYVNGHPVPVWTVIPFRFVLNE